MRDDLVGGEFNGNKARKLEYFLNADLSGIKRVVSYGSSQSNAMYSLSVFAKMKNLEFCYVVSNLNSNLAANPVGNLKFALQNGMKIYVDKDRAGRARTLADELAAGDEEDFGGELSVGESGKKASKFSKNVASDTAKQKSSLLINEGVWQKEAEAGFILQARQINEWAAKEGRVVDIFLPSGTGTSAAFLAKHVNFDVFTCPCVGDAAYLRREIEALVPNSNVQILPPPKKYHFGDLKPELYKIWSEACRQTGIEFELIYDPVGFLTMFANLHAFKNEILYIHQGGVLGNISQKQRYERKIALRKLR